MSKEATARPEIVLTPDEQVSSLAFAIGLCEDIADDVRAIDGWKDSGALLGILAVAENIIPSLKNISANISFSRSTLTEENARLLQENKAMREALENLIKAGANEIIHEGRGCTGRYVDAERRARAALEQSK